MPAGLKRKNKVFVSICGLEGQIIGVNENDTQSHIRVHEPFFLLPLLSLLFKTHTAAECPHETAQNRIQYLHQTGLSRTQSFTEQFKRDNRLVE